MISQGLNYEKFVEIVNFIGFLKKRCNFFKLLPTIRRKRIPV